MGANAAFSLYGHLKSKSAFSGCDKSTFINSFYTNQGFTDFETAMQYAGVSAFLSDNNGDAYSAECGGGYGVGCDVNNGFALHKYSTTTCNPDKVSLVIDEMYYANKAMQTVDCVQIYDASSSSSSYGYNDDNNGDDGGGGGSGDDSSYYSGTALGLLETSHACFYQNVWSPDGECPDPYGKIKYYQSNFGNAIEKSAATTPIQVSRQRMIYKHKIRKGQHMTAAGVVLVLAACVILATDKMISQLVELRLSKVRSVSTQSSNASPPQKAQPRGETYVAHNA